MSDRQTRNMINAADARDWQDVLLHVSSGANVNADDGYVIRKAAQFDEFGVVDYLAKNGANIHYQDDYALRIAAGHGHADTVKVLIEHGADVQARDNAALIEAAQDGAAQVVTLLLDGGADIHAQNDAALKAAIANDRAETEKIIRTYIEKESRRTAQQLDALLDTGIDALRQTGNGATGLVRAAQAGRFDEIMAKHADALTVGDLTQAGESGDSVVSVLARDGRLGQLCEPRYWAGRTDMLKQALAAVPEIYRDKYDLVSIFDRAKLRSLHAQTPRRRLKPGRPKP